MSIHINKFVDRIKAAESRSQRDVILTINEARDLHADITKILLACQDLQEKLSTSQSDAQVVSVEIDGGKF